MKTSERLKAIGEVSSEMQRRYSFIEIGTYFKSLGVKVPEAWDGPNSKRIYAAELLAMLPDDRIFEICEDLELSISTVASPVPKFWRDTNFLRLFISHISADKDNAVRLRECLLPYGISAFVAHEDIAPTLAWQVEIERALSHMHYFLSFHTAGFCQSNWTQQEIGFAVARKVKLLSLNMGEVPTGFIAREQAISRRARSAEEIAIEIRAILVDDKALSSFLQTESRSGDIPFQWAFFESGSYLPGIKAKPPGLRLPASTGWRNCKAALPSEIGCTLQP